MSDNNYVWKFLFRFVLILLHKIIFSLFTYSVCDEKVKNASKKI